MPSPPTPPKRARRVRPWMVALALCLIYLAFVVVRYGNVLELVRPGSQYAGNLSTYSRDIEGYDGQFDYYIAVDPVNAPAHMDVPAYRYQRALYPFLARLLALGQTPLVPYALVGINLAALAIGTALLERLLEAEHVSPWYALTYGLFAGVFVAVRASTNEPLAYALVLAAIWAAQRGRIGWCVGSLALAALTKETTLFFAAGYCLYYVAHKVGNHREWRSAAIITLGVGLPFAAWQIILRLWLGAWGIGSGGAGATPFEIVLFGGIWQLATYDLRVFVVFGVLAILIALVPTVWALWRVVRELRANRQHPYVYLLLANALVLPFLPFSTYREPLGLFRFLVGLVIGLLLYAAWSKARRALRYSSLWVLFGLTVLG
ncbi:MAG: AZOBR_p60025 family cell surface glycopolymer formation protein [Aggregatilineales bacterium]